MSLLRKPAFCNRSRNFRSNCAVVTACPDILAVDTAVFCLTAATARHHGELAAVAAK